jgi:acyl carrier protein
MNDLRRQVRSYIVDNFLFGAEPQALQDGQSLIDAQIVDSTGFIELVTYLEQTFGISVSDEEMTPENLDSVERIEAYLRMKLGARAEQ